MCEAGKVKDTKKQNIRMLRYELGRDDDNQTSHAEKRYCHVKQVSKLTSAQVLTGNRNQFCHDRLAANQPGHKHNDDAKDNKKTSVYSFYFFNIYLSRHSTKISNFSLVTLSNSKLR
ncbi:MAG: hypothetical protein HUJ51_06110 [Eggerthellaceae bacterium]|nr:hypothetical protein [Eggerthellaceae bacterium]